MREERLQEIKDSIEFQYTLAKAKGHDNALLFTDEEQELVEEIERLNNIIKEVREYIRENMKIISKEQAEDTRLPVGSFMWNVDKVLEILDKEAKIDE